MTEAATWRFNPPPGWPKPPPGWQPPAGWQPDPAWPAAPAGWNFWLPEPPAGPPPGGLPGTAGARAGWAGAHAAAHAGARSNDELRTALEILFPIRSWVHNSGWRQGLRLLVIVYALLPLIFLVVLASSSSLTAPGWAYSLYVAPLWLAGFWMLIRPGPIGRLQIQIGVGVAVFTVIWITIVTVHVNDAIGLPSGLLQAIGVGLNEEITKALPILLAGFLVLRYRQVTLEPRMCMFIGTIAGLTFGLMEQAIYTSSAIVAINQASFANQAVQAILLFAERVFVDGFQHAVWAGTAGFFIGMALNYHRRRVQLIALGIAVPALLHALNDWALAGLNSSFFWIVIQLASLLLFIGYTMSADSIEQRVRENPVFRGDSILMDRPEGI